MDTEKFMAFAFTVFMLAASTAMGALAYQLLTAGLSCK